MGDKMATAMALADDYIRANEVGAADESMEQGYMDSEYPEIQRGLTKNYLFGHGNKDDFERSIKERWRELYDAGLLTEAPANASDEEIDAYLDGLVEMVARWHGDAPGAEPTADHDGVVVELEQRGPAYII